VVWDGLDWFGLEWSGGVWSVVGWGGLDCDTGASLRRPRLLGLAWSGVGRHGLVWAGMEWVGLEWCGMVWAGMAWTGVVWAGLLPLAGQVWDSHGSSLTS
jgi:hypothetical protein